MKPKSEELLREALELPPIERAVLVDRLITSLDKADDAIDAARPKETAAKAEGNSMTEHLNVSRERRFSAHHMLLGAARMALQDAESKKPGWFYAELTALTLSGLAVEAICNAVGERVITDWKDFENASPIAKLRLICDKLGVSFDSNREPWSTARWLAKFRNEIAHAKPELVKESYVWTREEYDRWQAKEPKSGVERKITLGNAKRIVKRITEIKDLLCLRVPADEASGLYSDEWSGSAELLRDA
jgi:post-segregation antitoxin (ccd killing protein)